MSLLNKGLSWDFYVQHAAFCPRLFKLPLFMGGAIDADFEIDVRRCPRCYGRWKLIAFITQAPVNRDILPRRDLPSEPPVLSWARWPP